MSAESPLSPNPSPARGEGLNGTAPPLSSPLAGEEGARAEGVGRRGGKGDYLPLARGMRREPTDAERRLWSLLRGKRLAGWKFKRQEQIGDCIADFVCFGARLIVEADGSQHVENVGDTARDTYLSGEGFHVLRFWNNDILTNPDGVASAILAALDPSVEHPSPQTPLPQGERGLATARQVAPLPSRERKGPAAKRWEGEGANGAQNG